MVERLHLLELNDSAMKNKAFATDITLPISEEPWLRRWPSKMSWAEAVRHFAPMREQFMREFDSPEKRLREKNFQRFSFLEQGRVR